MANLPEIIQFDAGVYQYETTDPVQGGANGVANAPTKALANRTAWLKKHIDDLESGAFIPDAVAPKNSPALTGTPTAPTPAAGDNSTALATTAALQRSINGALTKSVAGGANVTLTAAEADRGILIFTGALTANISVILPSVTGSWVVANRTTGSFSLTVKTAAGTGVVVAQGRNLQVTCDTGVNIVASRTDFSGVDLVSATATTPPQFDNSKKIATTDALVARGVGHSKVVQYSVNTALTAADVGAHIVTYANAGPLTLTMPSEINLGIPDGAVMSFFNPSTYNITLTFPVNEFINATGGNVSSFVIKPGESLQMALLKSAHAWQLTSGSAQLGASASFANSKAASGYQKLPSGLIIQWGINVSGGDSAGTLVNLPIAFPNAFLSVFGGDSGQVCASFGCEYTGSLSQFRLYGRDNTGLFSNYACRWLAIGF